MEIATEESEIAVSVNVVTNAEENGNKITEDLFALLANSVKHKFETTIDHEQSKNSSTEEILGNQTLHVTDSDNDGDTSSYRDTDGQPEAITDKAYGDIVNIALIRSECDAMGISVNEPNASQKSDRIQNMQLASLSPRSDCYGKASATQDKIENSLVSSAKRNKINRIIDSDDSEGNNETEIDDAPKKSKGYESNMTKKLVNLIDSDSEVENDSPPSIMDKNGDLTDPSESPSKCTIAKKHTNKNKKKLSLIDSESESEVETMQNHGNEHSDVSDSSQKGTYDSSTTSKKLKSSSKPKRSSAKKALNEIQSIQSEQQRLHREAHINIPYHKPKKCTLQEFLRRRTVIQPGREADGSPAATVVKSKNLKMTPEELEEYAKLMEERAREATDFFKSESDESERELCDSDREVTHINEPMHSAGEQSESMQPSDSDETNGQLEAVDQQQSECDSKNMHKSPKSEVIAQMKDLCHEQQHGNMHLDKAFGETDGVAQELVIGETQMDLVEEELNNPESGHPHYSSKAVVTDVLELPKIDLSGLLSAHTTAENGASGEDGSYVDPLRSVEDGLSSQHRDPTKLFDLKRVIMEKKLCDSPTLQGDPDMMINLDTGDMVKKKPNGVDNLLTRLLATNKIKKSHSPRTMTILSTENGKVELSNVKLHTTPEELDTHNHKPGAAYIELKQKLKDIIKKKRRLEMQKKIVHEHEDIDGEDEFESKKYVDGEKSEQEGETEIRSKDECDPDTKLIKLSDLMIDDEENFREDGETKELNGAAANESEDGHHDVTTDEDAESNSDSIGGNEDDEKNIGNVNIPRKNRLIKVFLDDSDDSDEFKKPQVNQAKPTLVANTSILFEPEANKTLSDIEDELIDLCSGKFETQKSQLPIISQIPITQLNCDQDPTEELLELCSGKFDDQVEGLSNPTATNVSALGAVSKSTRANKIFSSDDETDAYDHDHDGDEEEHTKSAQKKATKRQKKLTKRAKKRIKLGFSDDEDDNETNTIVEAGDGSVAAIPNNTAISSTEEFDEMDAEEYEEIPQTFIDYDSEENEVVVELTKNDCVKQAEKFLENEAELSESDWGSADEDEKNMDEYDIELGDEDDFDREKLQTELGQIHARKMLDEDIKAVRKIHEFLFEDEETDGVGRQRQFKWKNAETGFSLDDNALENENKDAAESGDEENERQWRKIRFEREQLLREQQSNVVEKTALTLQSNIVSASSPTLSSIKRTTIMNTKHITSIEVKPNAPFLISREASAMHAKAARGSFLVRDKATLSKLAELTKSDNLNAIMETAGTVSIKTKSSKNFVFTTLTENEHEMLKRKAEDLLNNSTETATNYIKKRRVESREGKCLIDHLH